MWPHCYQYYISKFCNYYSLQAVLDCRHDFVDLIDELEDNDGRDIHAIAGLKKICHLHAITIKKRQLSDAQP